METGMIAPFAGASAPSGYLLCDGASYLRSSYSALFGVIGTVFGAADGTHFNVPDLRGRVPVGVGTGAGNAQSGTGLPYPPGAPTETYALGDWFGWDHSAVDIVNLPEHDHDLHDEGHNHLVQNPPHTHVQDEHNHMQDQHRHVVFGNMLADGGTSRRQPAAASSDDVQSAYATATNQPATATNQAAVALTNLSSAVTGMWCGQTGGNEPIDVRNPAVALNYLIKA